MKGTFQFLEPPRLLDFVLGSESDCIEAGALGARRFSNGFREATDLDLFLFFGVHTIPLITTPFTISSLVTVSFSDTSVSELTELLLISFFSVSSSFFPPLEMVFCELSLDTDPVLVTKLELETDLEGVDSFSGGWEEDGTFTHRLRRFSYSSMNNPWTEQEHTRTTQDRKFNPDNSLQYNMSEDK